MLRPVCVYQIWLFEPQLSVWAASSLSPSQWTHRADGWHRFKYFYETIPACSHDTLPIRNCTQSWSLYSAKKGYKPWTYISNIPRTWKFLIVYMTFEYWFNPWFWRVPYDPAGCVTVQQQHVYFLKLESKEFSAIAGNRGHMDAARQWVLLRRLVQAHMLICHS